MIDYLQARSIALESIGDENSLLDDLEFEKPYGWYFAAQSKAYLLSGEMRDMRFGSGGFIVERENGRIFQFGSGLPLEQ